MWAEASTVYIYIWYIVIVIEQYDCHTVYVYKCGMCTHTQMLFIYTYIHEIVDKKQIDLRL